MKMLIKSIEQMAANRPAGYLEDVMSKGTVDGEFIEIDQKSYGELLEKYRPAISMPMRGLGDMVAKVAQPIARAIDKVAGTHVAGCGGCKKRQEALNQMVPFNKTP